ncbi:uncharacterized protein V1510DRAFT_421510 [Dipodascopsis tothii]|uniref:uncharacterized protein n=1 Tax=Dipodascopsis tothii TaxID=44089 RepID=UPI0034CD2308
MYTQLEQMVLAVDKRKLQPEPEVCAHGGWTGPANDPRTLTGRQDRPKRRRTDVGGAFGDDAAWNNAAGDYEDECGGYGGGQRLGNDPGDGTVSGRARLFGAAAVSHRIWSAGPADSQSWVDSPGWTGTATPVGASPGDSPPSDDDGRRSHGNSEEPDLQEGMRNHTISQAEPSPPGPDGDRPRRLGYVMGFRADCAKCQDRVKGHYSHFIPLD